MPINRHHNYAQNDRRPSRPQFLQVPGGDGFSSSFQQQNNEIDEKLPSRSRSLGCNNYDSQFGGGFELQTMGFKRPMPAMSSTSHQSVLSSSSSWKSTSPSSKTNLTYPKKRYSVARKDSLMQIETPLFTMDDLRMRKDGPSSPRTVLLVAGLFACGLILMISGMIVLIFHSEFRSFVLTGILFFVTGLAMIVICIVLQRKNVVKFIVGLNQDLFLSLRSDRHSKVFVASRVNSPTPFRFPSRLQ